jgi:hypothetical protein
VEVARALELRQLGYRLVSGALVFNAGLFLDVVCTSFRFE